MVRHSVNVILKKDKVSMKKESEIRKQKLRIRCCKPGIVRQRSAIGTLLLATVICLFFSGVLSAEMSAGNADKISAPPTLEETRMKMDKWLEIQQMISKERKDWQQGKEILLGRLELVRKEIATLQEKTREAESSVTEFNKKRSDFLAENNQLTAAGAQLTGAIAGMEGEIREMFKQLPEPIRTKLQPLYQRVPENPSKTQVATAERYQNILGILNELNRGNNDISVSYEVHNLADGRPSEVKAIYVGLAQAYYVSARGEAGIGRPTADGWKWEPSKSVARDVMKALEIIEGKQSPAFVPLPVRLK